MITPTSWKKSSFSGGGEGNDCVEVADLDTHISVRDSKAPALATLTFPAPAFATFLDALKAATPSAGAARCLPG
ncbi:DUF397 domain-containing protein [Streptomyces cinerochromogenes]|uniref:DUF397 domain-containing protein n=1 Tax=Streptomyces cinerochromogenes TaxID=66422 RepID=A0ABW7B8D2_9ACTN